MKLIKPSFEIKEQGPGYAGILKHIEWVGRHCYKSLDKITEESAPKFVDMLVKRGHTAMVEHGTVYLRTYSNYEYGEDELFRRYSSNPYSIVKAIGRVAGSTKESDLVDGYYITTNYRVLLQNGWFDDLKYQCEPTEYHVKRITVKFVCDRGVSHEFVRHRVFSFAQESTRYCNYSKDKFGKECTFIIPCWLDIPEGSTDSPEIPVLRERYGTATGTFLNNLYWAEANYFDLLEQGWIAQQARAVLPNSLKTELIMTGTIEQWEGFFKLRDANDAHPQARELAAPLHEEFIRRGLLQ